MECERQSIAEYLIYPWAMFYAAKMHIRSGIRPRRRKVGLPVALV
jgi:hypothetical protein